MDIRCAQAILLVYLFGGCCEDPLRTSQNQIKEDESQYTNLLSATVGRETFPSSESITIPPFNSSDVGRSVSSKVTRRDRSSSSNRRKQIKLKCGVCHCRSRYRTIDGSCNNLRHPNWGKANTAYKRMLPSLYSNGTDGFRVSKSGQGLPNPRLISRILTGDELQSSVGPLSTANVLFVHWGQFLCHDVAFTPLFQGDGAVNCCKNKKHPECVSLSVDFKDPFYDKGDCMEFPRSDFIRKKNKGRLGRGIREQINILSCYIDASNVYDITKKKSKFLRENNGKGAKLKSVKDVFEIPIFKKSQICRSSVSRCGKCPLIGERRGIATPVLMAIHTLWLREHNRLVDLLRHKKWKEQKLFKEVRKIIGALMQHIAYNEYLPLLLGKEIVEKFNLTIPSASNPYDRTVDASITNVFAAAALRYGHSMLTRRVLRASLRLTKSPRLSQDFFSVNDFCPKSNKDPVVEILTGQMQQHSAAMDHIFTKEMTNFLFSESLESPGFDVLALDIMRGRDHGLRPYNDWRVKCNLPKIQSYEQLTKAFLKGIPDKVIQIYGSNGFDDIDLFVGGISEKSVSDSLLGPTFTCLIAEQFRRLKVGDRFWYENLGQVSSFTKAQVEEIRKSTLSSLICRNTKLNSIQPAAFLPYRRTNQLASCSKIIKDTDINLKFW